MSVTFHRTDVTDVTARLRLIRDELAALYYERDEVITAMLCALLAGEHLFMLGPPGTGKSDLCRTLVRRLVGAVYFETLMSRTRMPEDVYGPLDVPLLSTTGEYVRKIDGYMLTADVVFLDEFGKMGPVLGHTMLGALQERVRHEVNASGSVHPIPLSTAFTASNELPVNDDSPDAAALWDRMLFRVTVDYIQGDADMMRLLTRRQRTRNAVTPTVTTVDWKVMRDLITEAVPFVQLPDAVAYAALAIRRALNTAKIVVSDRRWDKSMLALQAHACLEGRDTVTLADLKALEWTLWSTPEQRPTVHRTITEAIDPLAKDVAVVTDAITEQLATVRATRGQAQGRRAGAALEAGKKLRALEREIKKLEGRYAVEMGDVTGAALIPVTQYLDAARDEVSEIGLVEE